VFSLRLFICTQPVPPIETEWVGPEMYAWANDMH
jgi:hypothetical protein